METEESQFARNLRLIKVPRTLFTFKYYDFYGLESWRKIGKSVRLITWVQFLTNLLMQLHSRELELEL